MNSFTLTAIGNLAADPELIAKSDTAKGDTAGSDTARNDTTREPAAREDTLYTRFCLVGNDYAGRDEGGGVREAVTSVWFVAFGTLGEAIARNARKGDQLIIDARIRANNWIDRHGEKQYDYSFVVQGFRFGAPGRMKRGELDARREHLDRASA
ncbi:single-stranded DNA-binding protein [Steroidobacter denitrificans]|uniref:single-stranded DNA-binding protein n=1 Tax=Steroidobacter denitrificans TaxID=465721 RepID=UPI0009F89CA4|nr:single-stranded DNA-binding protein [Steroidobacter denitrificans]